MFILFFIFHFSLFFSLWCSWCLTSYTFKNTACTSWLYTVHCTCETWKKSTKTATGLEKPVAACMSGFSKPLHQALLRLHLNNKQSKVETVLVCWLIFFAASRVPGVSLAFTSHLCKVCISGAACLDHKHHKPYRMLMIRFDCFWFHKNKLF